MKLDIKYISAPHVVEGTCKLKEKNAESESSLILRLQPGMTSLFINFQKIKIERSISDKKKQPQTPYMQFVRESAQILNNYELEFNTEKIPLRIVNHDKIWKKWPELMEILASKYSGPEVDKELGYMTAILGNEKKLLDVLLNDFPIRELYGRELHLIKFDKDSKCHREFQETAFSEKILFKQDCFLKITQKKDILRITGAADLHKNKNQMLRICEKSGINPEHVKTIEQETVYAGSHIALIPETVETKFTIKAEGEILKQEIITLTIE